MKLDKKKHLILGMIIWLATITTLLILKQPVIYSLIPVYLAGVGKELVWDKLLGKGTPEIMDAVYTVFIPTILTLILIIVNPLSLISGGFGF